jgi:hypothetical protein
MAPKDIPGKMKKLFTCPGSRVLPLTWSGLGLGLGLGLGFGFTITVRDRAWARAKVTNLLLDESHTYQPTHLLSYKPSNLRSRQLTCSSKKRVPEP